MDADYTQVRLRRSTCERLKKLGGMGDSYDKLINKILNDLSEDVKNVM